MLGAGLWLLVAAGFLLTDYYRLRPFLFHPVIFGVAGSMALAVALALLVRHQVLKWLAVILVVLAGLGWGAMVWFGLSFRSSMTEEVRRPSPDGDMELVLYSGSQAFSIDPVLWVRVYTDRGLLSREGSLGCVNLERDRIEQIEWTGPRTVRVDLSRAGSTTITLDDGGRPDRTIDGGC